MIHVVSQVQLQSSLIQVKDIATGFFLYIINLTVDICLSATSGVFLTLLFDTKTRNIEPSGHVATNDVGLFPEHFYHFTVSDCRQEAYSHRAFQSRQWVSINIKASSLEYLPGTRTFLLFPYLLTHSYG